MTAPANGNGSSSTFSTTNPNSQNSSTTAAAQFNNTQATQQSTTQNTTQNTFVGAIPETQVTTIVQQLDTEGPAVVQTVGSQLGELACSPETVDSLVHALHDGTAVTLTANVNGQPQTATFTPTGARLGYGESYIALALAAQELRNAGITSCATPDQWQAVLDGGTLSTSTTVSTTAAPAQFPGILVLRSQGQGWGQIAQSSNVQLGQVLAGASNRANNSAPSETGYSSSQFSQVQNPPPDQKGHRKYWLFGPRSDKSANPQAPAPENQSTNPPPAPTPTR